MDAQNWGDPNQRMTEYSRQSPPYQERAPWQDANADSDHQRISSSTTAQTMSTSSCLFSSYGNQYQQNASPQGSLFDQRRYPSAQNQSGSMQLQCGSHQPPHQSQHFGSQGQVSYQYGQQPQMFPQQHYQGSPSRPSYHYGQQTPPAPQSQGHQSSCNGQSGMNDEQARICAAASQDMMQLATSSLAGVRQSPNYDHLRVSVDPNSGNSDPKTTSIKVVSTTTKKKETSAHEKREKKQSTKSSSGRKEADSKGRGQQYEQQVQMMISRLGACPQLYQWYRVQNGYICAGGTHFLPIEEVDAYVESPMAVPTVVLVNTLLGDREWNENVGDFTIAGIHPPPVDPWQPMHRRHQRFVQRTTLMGFQPCATQEKDHRLCECYEQMGIKAMTKEEATTKSSNELLRQGGFAGLVGGFGGMGAFGGFGF